MTTTPTTARLIAVLQAFIAEQATMAAAGLDQAVRDNDAAARACVETINRAVDAVVDSIRPVDGRFGWGDGMWNDITDVIPSLDELFDIVDNDAFENITLESAREGARKFLALQAA